jgi:hypothetical protein
MDYIEKVKVTHLKWLKEADDLVNGVENKFLPISCEKCECTLLINNETINENLLEEIETIHFLLHDNYIHIHELLSENKNPSKEDTENAKEYFEMLKTISDSFLESLEQLR